MCNGGLIGLDYHCTAFTLHLLDLFHLAKVLVLSSEDSIRQFGILPSVKHVDQKSQLLIIRRFMKIGLCENKQYLLASHVKRTLEGY